MGILFLFYARKNDLVTVLGLTKVSFVDAKESLFYIPLLVVVLANGVFFFDKATSAVDMLLVIVFMFFVAFLEELIFRGFLFKLLEERSNTGTAILISGALFGFGHIINLLNGYNGVSQIIQIFLAVLIGILLCVLFIRTKSIVPGVIFHFIFNSASALSVDVKPLYDIVSAGIIIVVSAVYLVYLLKNGLSIATPVFNDIGRGKPNA